MKPRRTKLLLALFSVSAFMAGACLAKDNPRETGLRTAEIARFEANVKADIAALEKLLDADLEYTHSNGDRETKAQFIESLATGARDYLAMEASIESLRIYGDVAVIHGSARVSVSSKNTANKPSTFSISYTDVWLWKGGRWQMTDWRSKRLPDTPAP